MKKNNHPRGLRNNNPLNIIKNKTVRWLGETNCESGLDQSDRNELLPYLENAWSLL